MKLVFFDIDGTLLPEGEKEIAKDVVDAIKSIKNDDTEIFICTGRCYHQAKPFLDQLNLDSYITSNGQEVCYKNEIIYESRYNDDQKRSLVHLAKKFDLDWGFETRSNINLASGVNTEYIKSIIEGYGFLDVEVSNDLNKDIYQFWFFGDNSNVKNAVKQLDDEFKCYAWNKNSLEILPALESKANGISKVIERFDSVETYAFGDGVNDYEMLKFVDVSVAMGNANDEIKQIATFVTSDCREDGIVNGLKKVGLRK